MTLSCAMMAGHNRWAPSQRGDTYHNVSLTTKRSLFCSQPRIKAVKVTTYRQCIYVEAAADLGSSENSKRPRSSPPPPRPVRRALGVDYGRKQIGLAVSTLGLAPRPLPGMRGGGLEVLLQLGQSVVDTALSEGCDAIVVGLPVTRAGSLRRRDSDSQQGRRCRNFGEAVAILARPKGLTVFLADETMTTALGTSMMYLTGAREDEVRRKKDSVAAALILSAFFDDQEAAVRVRQPMNFNSSSRRLPPRRRVKGEAPKKMKEGLQTQEQGSGKDV